VEYSGEVATLSIAPLTIAVLKGLLTPIMKHPVNYVNAPIVAKERGIEVKEVKSTDAGDVTSLIRVRVETGKVHDADAYVCVAHRNDLGPLAEALGTERPAPDGDAVAVIAQSRVGDRVCGTATEADGWTVDESGCEPFRELREQLTAMLLPRA